MAIGEASSKPVPVGIAPFPRLSWVMPPLAETASLVRGWRISPRALFGAIRESATAERERWALWLPVAFGCGIGIYFALPVEPSRAVGFAVGFIGICAAVAATRFSSDTVRFLLALSAAILVGLALAKWRTESVRAPVLVHRIGPVALVARVEWAQEHGKGIRVLLSPIKAGWMRADETPRRVRILVRNGGSILKPGAIVRVKAVLLPPPPPAEPGDYDFGRAAYFQQIGAVGYAFGAPLQIAPAPAPDFFSRSLIPVESLRWRIAQRIHEELPGSTGSVAAALIAGDRGGISQPDEQALRDAGLAHVLAIAGLHMALVGLGLFWVVRAALALVPSLALTQPIKKWAAAAALFGAGFYLVISGAATPATRAFVMLAAMLVAIILDRPALSMRSLAFAAVIVLFARPESLLEPGFQMSFAAVASLIAVAEWERSRPRSGEGRTGIPVFRSAGRYLRGIAMTSFVGSIATMPYAAFHFDRATHYAVLGNLLAMPIMGFVTMPAAALAILLMPLQLDGIPLHVMGWGIEAMLAVGRWVSHLPGATATIAAWPMSALVLISLGCVWIVIWRRIWRWLGLLPAFAGVVVIAFGSPPDLLVSRDGETVAIRGNDDRLYFVRRPADEYSASEWLKRDGDSRSAVAAVGDPAHGIRCDAYGCIAKTRNGLRIAVVARRDALAEDCGYADIVVSAVPVRESCSGPKLVIDRFEVAREGAHAVWLNDGVKLGTVNGVRGARPWTDLSSRKTKRPPSTAG